jgi:hypothetical protein
VRAQLINVAARITHSARRATLRLPTPWAWATAWNHCSRLQAVGEVVFDSTNPTHTSSRRLDQCLLYNAVVTVLYYYLLGYALNRTFGRPVLGTAPAFRQTLDPARPCVGPPARLPCIAGATWLIAAWRRS